MYFKPYRYIKAPLEKRKRPGTRLDSAVEPRRRGTRLFEEFFPLGLVFLGSFILSTQIIIPFISFPNEESLLLSPTEWFLAEGEILGGVSGVESLEDRPVSTRQSSRGGKEREEKKNVPPIFFLSIPKLGIEKAKVKTDTRDPDPKDFLGHFLGSALPGEPGAVFIYGHSTFPWLFDPEDYLTIFSALPKLEKGDKIIVFFNEQVWEYEVEGFKTLDPGQIDLGSFSTDKPRLVLMTCVPPGTRLKRFFVLAGLSRLTPPEL